MTNIRNSSLCPEDGHTGPNFLRREKYIIYLTLDKIGKTCVVHLTPKKVQFILTSDTDGVQVWSGINPSKNNNEIAFELSLDTFRGLKSGQLVTDITMKLTKKQNVPYLSILCEVQQNWYLTYYIPVELS